jgi:CBS domain-containing protein
MDCGKLVKDEVQWILPDQTVRQAAELMAAHRLGWLPICGYDFKPVGVITDHDIVERVVAKGRASEETLVEDVMSTPAHAVAPDCSVDVAADVMARLQVSRLVVVDASGRLEGVITLAALLDELVHEGGDDGVPSMGRVRLGEAARVATVAEPPLPLPDPASGDQAPGWGEGMADDSGASPLDQLDVSVPSEHDSRTARLRNAGHALAWVVACALVVRLLAFAFAENKHADAPMRALLAEYRSTTPGATWDPRTFFQFGPLPIALTQAFMAFGGDGRVLSRVPPMLAGLALFLPFIALARRLTVHQRVVVAATLALALAPLAIQLSTTAASEPIYLLFWLACLERLHAALSADGHDDDELAFRRRRRQYLAAGCWASLAAVSRYDAWLAIPVATAAMAWWGPRDRRGRLDLLLFVLAAAALPAVYLLWMRAAGVDPWSFARIIAHDHAMSAAAVAARLGGFSARLHQLSIWTLGLAAAMTPVGLVGLPLAVSHWRRFSTATRVLVVAALAPMVLYLVKGLVFGNFEPLARFALVPGVLLLPLALDALAVRVRTPRLDVAVAAGAVAFAVTVLIAAFGRPGAVRAAAETLAPVTRLERDARAVARYLAEHRRPRESVFVDTANYVDIMIAHAARVPLPQVATLWRTRVLSDSLAEEHSRSQATLFAAHDSSWGARPLRDWPPGSMRFGRWRVARME